MNLQPAIDRRPSRVGPWMGIAFVVLFVGGFLAFPAPMSDDPISKWNSWWTDSGHRTLAIVAAYLMVLGGIAFVVFAWDLRQRMRDSAGSLITTFASMFVVIALVSTLVRAAIPGGKTFGSVPVPSGELARNFDNLGFAMLLVAGALCAGACLATASFLARRHAVLPGWLAVSGYVVAVLQLGATLFFPFVLFPLWVLVASIVLLRRGMHAETAASAASAATAATT